MGLILSLNPGSSSLKAALRAPDLVRSVRVERVGDPEGTLRVDGDTRPFSGDLGAAVDAVAGVCAAPEAVAIRVVHGGDRPGPALWDDALTHELRALVPLAPLHQPGSLETYEHARRAWPDARFVACFDTAFHQALPEASTRLPIPADLAALGVRRYGFHGLSVESVLLRRPDLGDTVVAHLGSGCSVTAVAADHTPRHTTMSFTPTGGMMSATRSGDVDPAILPYLIERHGMTASGLRDLFDHHGGLAGISGRHDVRDLLDADDEAARLALEVFVRSAAMAIASCATTLDDWRALVFTGGIGEHAAGLRDRITCRLPLPRLGVAVHVVESDEELVMDHQARLLAT
ncbi:hypothetical protein GCM10022243_57900 [Saccharothrix violaceirubra]|uniref:Acetate kinase n=1 Tax=Saccharothrix violaceirubra TaxID=413306 RepID=A0A7W7WWN2_9PSEU|nr:hypothetical protein [Saccharothrix violaceirubra]MBB4965778.1 acetate kinase [Saccharothrix violaceirubra]